MVEENDRQQSKVPQRGTLKVAIEPSTPTLSAASNFSIAVNITNPFDVPITVGDVSTQLPIDLYDVAAAVRRTEQEQAQSQIEKIRQDLLRDIGDGRVSQGWHRVILRPLLQWLFRTVFPFLPAQPLVSATSMAVAQVGSVEWKSPNWRHFGEALVQLIQEPQIVEKEESLSEEEIQAKVENALRPIREEFERIYEEQIEQKVNLQPGDSITKVFNLRTRKGLTFKPASYNLNIVISYRADNVAHTQTMPYALDIQASIISVIIGAGFGSVFGVIARNPNVLSWKISVILPRMLSAMVLSGFVVIAFARKKGIQPVIAIQDFWGGLLIGFIVGYSGTQAFANLFEKVG